MKQAQVKTVVHCRTQTRSFRNRRFLYLTAFPTQSWKSPFRSFSRNFRSFRRQTKCGSTKINSQIRDETNIGIYREEITQDYLDYLELNVTNKMKGVIFQKFHLHREFTFKDNFILISCKDNFETLTKSFISNYVSI